jgi:hypothetical protein
LVSREGALRFSSQVDRPFMAIMSLVLAAVFVAGFGPSYVDSIAAPGGLPLWVHLHGVVMAAWILLFVVQGVLIRSGARALHQRLGLLSIALVAVLVPLGSATNVLCIARGATPPFFTPAELFASDQLDLLLFTALYAWALVLRRTPAWHKRLLVCAVVLLTYPAIARMSVVRHFGLDLIVPISVALVLVLAMIGPLHDLARYRRVHPAFAWGAAIIFLAQPAHELLAASAPVQALVAGLVPPHAMDRPPGDSGDRH